MVEKKTFSGVDFWTLRSDKLCVGVSALGAAVTDIHFLGRSIALGYDSLSRYRAGRDYLGAVIGRCANRVSGGRFPWKGGYADLQRNENGNTLHGGANSWDKRLWTGEIDGDALRLRLFSPDGDNGFPGALRVCVSYCVNRNALRIDLEGDAESDTVFAPTSHIYFNLRGAGSVFGTRVRLLADQYLETDEQRLPTGRLLRCEGGFDLRRTQPLARCFDHAFVLSDRRAFEAEADGVRLTLDTDFPALHFYTGDALGAPFEKHGGFALEPECFPDAPNHPNFPSVYLAAGEHFHRFALYRFSRATQSVDRDRGSTP